MAAVLSVCLATLHASADAQGACPTILLPLNELCGLAILVVGVLVKIGHNRYYPKYLDQLFSNLTFPSITLIVIGSIIFIIAFLGCCGTIRESHCMMVTFASLLLTILIIQVAVAIYVFVTVKNFGDISFKDAYTIFLFYNYPKGGEEKEYVDAIQEGLQCCGVDGPDDFARALNMSIPGTCCGKSADDLCEQMYSYMTGCADALKVLFKKALNIMGGVAVGVAAGELIGIIFALCLANSIKNAERRGYSV